MYPISSDVLALLRGSHEEYITIDVHPISGTSFTLTQSDITENSLIVERHCVTGQTIELGSASASELSFRIKNENNRYENMQFEGAELYVRFNVKAEGGITNNYIPLGYFTIDDVKKHRTTIDIVAIDRMVHFDKEYDNTLIYPATVREIIQNACTACNISCYTLLSSLPNCNYMVAEPPVSPGLIYRNIIMWCAEITGTCAYIDWTGQLRFEWYENTGFQLTPSDRFDVSTSQRFENDVIVSGVDKIQKGIITSLADGEGTYRLTIEENELIQGDGALSYSHVIGTKYRPFKCPTLGLPHMYPLDKIDYIDLNGNILPTIITHIEWKFRGRTQIQAAGISETKSGYAKINSLTAREKGIIKEIAKEDINKQLTQMEQATLLLNQMMFGSLGLYFTTVVGVDGDKQIYAHDKPTLAESSTIYTMNAGGFAYTNIGWNDGDPIWLYGFTNDGNAVYKALSVYHLSADLITAGTMTADHIKGGSLVLGGANNTDGILQIKNASGAIVMQADNTGLKVSNAVITGGSINLPASSNTEGKITTSYGSDYTQLMPGGMVVDGIYNGQRYEVNVTPSLLGVTALSASGVIEGTGELGFDAIMHGKQSIIRFNQARFDQAILNNNTDNTLVNIIGGTISVGVIDSTITGQLSAGPPWYSYSTLNIGQLVATQSKSKVEKTENYNDRLLYCYEMPSPMYGDIGGGQTDESGICYIDIDPVFFETLENTFEYYVFLTKYGDGDIHVSEITKEYFVVKGSPNLKFAWEIKGKQKGFGLDRLEEYDIENSKKVYDEELPNLSDAIYDNIAEEIISEYERELGI